MATRRKYKVPHFRDGGRVMQDVPIEGDAPATGVSNTPVEAGFPAEILGDHPPAEQSVGPGTLISESPVADENPLMHALHAQRRAEELQREAAQREAPQPPPPSALEQHIQKIPNLSEHKRAFLRQFPVLIEDPVVQQIFNRHYVEALQNGGFTDDTAALDNHLIAATAREIEQRRQQLAPAHEPARTIEEEVQRLDDEIDDNRRSEAPPPRPARRSMPMSAPVSRDVHMPSGQRQSDSNGMTLSPEERRIARTSYSAPGMTDAQKEYEYARNKRRMIQAKLNGEIQGDG